MGFLDAEAIVRNEFAPEADTAGGRSTKIQVSRASWFLRASSPLTNNPDCNPISAGILTGIFRNISFIP